MSTPPTVEPGQNAAEHAQRALEDTISALRDAPVDFDRALAAEQIRRALALLYEVRRTTPAQPRHLDGLRESFDMVGELRQRLRALEGGHPALETALDRLALARSALELGIQGVIERTAASPQTLRSSIPPMPISFRASRGAPELHTVSRGSLVRDVSLFPRLEVPAPPVAPSPRSLDKPETLEALGALAALGPAALAASFDAPGPDTSAADGPSFDDDGPREDGFCPRAMELDTLRRLARDCLEDMATYRDLRKPNELETWTDQGPFEQRLLDNLDAFAAIGPVALAQVSTFVAEAATPDPGRAFAASLALGCVAGADTVDVALALLTESAPETWLGFVEGLSLASNRQVDRAMQKLLGGTHVELWGVALDVATRRRSALPARRLSELANEAPAPVLAAIAGYLGKAGPREDAVPLLSSLAVHANDEVALAAVASLLRRGYGPARATVRSWLTDSSASTGRRCEAGFLLCLCGEASDLEQLLAPPNFAPSERWVHGLGRFGHLDAGDTLVSLLSAEDEAIALAAAWSLERILATGVRETLEVPWEIDVAEELLEGFPLPTRKVDRPSTDPAYWKVALHKLATSPDREARRRGGGLFHPLQIVGELIEPSTPPQQRVDAELELAIVTGLTSRFEPDDWVARQHDTLADLERRVRAASIGAGRFGLAGPAPATPSSPLEPSEEATLTSRTMQLSLADLMQKSALPFSGSSGPAAAVVTASPASATASPPPRSSSLDETLPPSTQPDRGARRAALPFLRDVAPDASQPPPPSVEASPATEPHPVTEPHPPQHPQPTGAPANPGSVTRPDFGATYPSANRAPVLPFQPPGAEGRPSSDSPPPTDVVRLTLEQYAWLLLIEKRDPDQYRALRRQAGVADDREWRAANDAWSARLRRDTAVRQHFERLLRGYRSWIERGGGAPR